MHFGWFSDEIFGFVSSVYVFLAEQSIWCGLSKQVLMVLLANAARAQHFQAQRHFVGRPRETIREGPTRRHPAGSMESVFSQLASTVQHNAQKSKRLLFEQVIVCVSGCGVRLDHVSAGARAPQQNRQAHECCSLCRGVGFAFS